MYGWSLLHVTPFASTPPILTFPLRGGRDKARVATVFSGGFGSFGLLAGFGVLPLGLVAKENHKKGSEFTFRRSRK